MRPLYFDEHDFPERMELAVDLKREYDDINPEDLFEPARSHDAELGQFWSPREYQRTDKEWRVYSPEERRAYEDFVAANPGKTMPAIKPWSFPAFTGVAARPRRIGG
jgi:hypothetical protein